MRDTSPAENIPLHRPPWRLYLLILWCCCNQTIKGVDRLSELSKVVLHKGLDKFDQAEGILSSRVPARKET